MDGHERDTVEKRGRTDSISRDSAYRVRRRHRHTHLPAMDRIEQVTWVMKKIMEPLREKIVEIGIDATCT